MNDWNKPAERETAFRTVLEKAMKEDGVKRALLDPTTAQHTLETYGEIKLPPGMTVIFVKQEDKPDRLVMQIPAAAPIPFEPIALPGFNTCFLGLWITYSSEFQNFQRLMMLAKQFEMKNL